MRLLPPRTIPVCSCSSYSQNYITVGHSQTNDQCMASEVSKDFKVYNKCTIPDNLQIISRSKNEKDQLPGGHSRGCRFPKDKLHFILLGPSYRVFSVLFEVHTGAVPGIHTNNYQGFCPQQTQGH